MPWRTGTAVAAFPPHSRTGRGEPSGLLNDAPSWLASAVEIIVTSVVAVLGTLLGSLATHYFQRRNRADAERFTAWSDGVPEPRRRLLCDAMTSGGLLAAIPAGAAMEGAVIGRLVPGEAGTIVVA